MSHENLTAIPEQIVAGTQVNYRRTTSHFLPSQGWGMKLYLVGGDPASPVIFSKDFTVSDESFLMALLASDTVSFTRGNYQWEERVTNAAEKHRFDFGSIEVLPDLATATASSMLSRAAKMLVAVRAAIDIRMGIGGTATDLIESYSIGGRSITKMPLKELIDVESRLAMAVRREANPGQWGPRVKVHFTAPDAEPWPA